MSHRLLSVIIALGMLCTPACSTTPTVLVDEAIALERPFLVTGQRLPRATRDRAADAYEEACVAGFEVSCALFERLMVPRRPSVNEFLAGMDDYADDCEDGDGKACFRLGLLFDGAGGLGVEPVRSLELYHRACNARYDYACQRAAELHVVLFGYGASNMEIRRLTRRSCRAGYAEACVVDANLAKLGRGGPRDLVESRRLLGQACRRGETDACLRLAKWHAYRDDKATARTQLEQLYKPMMGLCERGHVYACAVAIGVAAEPLAANASMKPWLMQACLKGGILEICRTMHEMRAVPSREGTEKLSDTEVATLDGKLKALRIEKKNALKRTQPPFVDRAREREFWRKYYEKRCFRQRQLSGCMPLQHWRDSHRSLAAQAERQGQLLAKEMIAQRSATYTRGCNEDDAFACFQLADLVQSTTKPSPQRQARLNKLRTKARRLEAKIRAGWAKPTTGPATQP